MFVQVVTYSLEGISEDAYLDVATDVAPRYASLPGLLAKIWLENPGANRYGAVYFWEDVESMERFGESDLFEDDTPEFVEFVSEEFKVLENLTAQTQPVLQVLEDRASAARVGSTAKPAPAPAAPAPASATASAGGVKRTPPPRRSAAATTPTPPKKAAPAPKAAGPKKAATAKKAAATARTAGKKAAATASKAAATKAPAKKAGRKAVR